MKHHNHYIINYNQIILSVDKINKKHNVVTDQD